MAVNIENLLDKIKENRIFSIFFVFLFVFKELGFDKSDLVVLGRFFFDLLFKSNNLIFMINTIFFIVILFYTRKFLLSNKKTDENTRLYNRKKEIHNAYKNNIASEKYENIRKTLIELLNYYKASRIWFFVYHNGGFTPTGIGKKKMSIVFEFTNVGIDLIGTRFLDMDVNFFPDWIKTFVRQENVIVQTLRDKVPQQWLEITESSGYKSLYSSGLWTEENMPYGFFGMGFNYQTILNEKQLAFYYETQKKLNEIISQERCYTNIL